MPRQINTIAAALSLIRWHADPVCPQERPVPAAASARMPADGAPTAPPDQAADDRPDPSSRLFGVLPNTPTIEPQTAYARVTTRQSFGVATEDSFDQAVYPLAAFLGIGQPAETDHTISFADNTTAHYRVSAVLPATFAQCPRHFAHGSETAFCRFAYAATRSVVTRLCDAPQLNASEIGGNLTAATPSNLHDTPSERSLDTALGAPGRR